MQVRIQNILMPTEDFGTPDELYFHMSDDGRQADFDGYFNLLYIEKRKKYTGIDSLFLNVSLEGYDEITLMHDRDEISSYNLDDGSGDYRFEFPYVDFDDGVFWFRLKKNDLSMDTHVSGFYEGEIGDVRRARVFVDICTYRREDYVFRNLRRIKAFLADETYGYIRKNMIFCLVDNGRTLKDDPRVAELVDSASNIRIVENRNTGGAGGFRRGMEEAIRAKDADGYTHVLLMDDDAAYDCDLFVRLFGILMTLRDEYSDITVGGALWREDIPFIQHASGEWFERMSLYNPMLNLDMRSYDECTQEEVCSTSHEYDRYSGWWCCCYSLNTVRRDNLPLPMFVHGDDIEYEKRNRLSGNPIVFINGFGVWHRAFDSAFNGIKDYYDFRNYLTLTAIHEPNLSKVYIIGKIGRMLLARCFERNYAEMELAFMGAMDFLKGREWFLSIDPEEHHMRMMEHAQELIRFVPIEEIEVSNKEAVLAEANKAGEGVNLEKLFEHRGMRPSPVSAMLMCFKHGMFRPHKKGAALATPDETFWRMNLRYKETVRYNPSERKAMVVKADPRQLLRVYRMYRDFRRGMKNYPCGW